MYYLRDNWGGHFSLADPIYLLPTLCILEQGARDGRVVARIIVWMQEGTHPSYVQVGQVSDVYG